MIIACTSELLTGETAEVDRECEVWYEKDYIVYGSYSVMIYPKLCWKPVQDLILPNTPIESPNK